MVGRGAPAPGQVLDHVAKGRDAIDAALAVPVGPAAPRIGDQHTRGLPEVRQVFGPGIIRRDRAAGGQGVEPEITFRELRRFDDRGDPLLVSEERVAQVVGGVRAQVGGLVGEAVGAGGRPIAPVDQVGVGTLKEPEVPLRGVVGVRRGDERRGGGGCKVSERDHCRGGEPTCQGRTCQGRHMSTV